jgi:hypothetical protein
MKSWKSCLEDQMPKKSENQKLRDTNSALAGALVLVLLILAFLVGMAFAFGQYPNVNATEVANNTGTGGGDSAPDNDEPETTATPMPEATDVPVMDETPDYPDLTACGVEVVSGPYVSKYEKNADDGSGSSVTLWLAGQGFTDPSNWIMALLQPGASLDLEAEEISSYGWKILGSMEQAECAARAIVDFYNVSAYLYSPNVTDLDSDWSASLPWAGYVWFYQEEQIYPGGDWSDDMPLAKETHELCGPDGGYANAQLWNNDVGPDNYQPVVQDEWCLTTPKLQGTWSTVTGNFDFELLVERYHQTAREVDFRDEHPPVHQFWCGNPEDILVGYSSELPAGFSCSQDS